MIAALAFYVFAAIMLVSASMVVTARNPVHSVLFLILTFFNAAALFVLAGAEFLAMILVIVYVGAVAVLFLFVVMMLDIDFTQLREGFQRYLPVGLAVGLVLLVELVMVLGGWKIAPEAMSLRFAPIAAGTQNTAQIGKLLYTDYFLIFQISGLILLVAMIGAAVADAIALGHQHVHVQGHANLSGKRHFGHCGQQAAVAAVVVGQDFVLCAQGVDCVDQVDQILRIVQIGHGVARLLNDLTQDACRHAVLAFAQVDQDQCGVCFVGIELGREGAAHIVDAGKCGDDQAHGRCDFVRGVVVTPLGAHGQAVFAHRNGNAQGRTQL